MGLITFLSIPHVQNILFGKLLKKLSIETHFNMQHTCFSFKWFHQIVLTDFEIRDSNNQLVADISHLKMRLNPLTLIWGKQLTINYLELNRGQLDLVKNKEEAYFNLEILLAHLGIDKSTSQTNTTHKKNLLVKRAVFKDLSLRVDDQNLPHVSKGFDPHHIQVEGVTVDLAQLRYETDSLMGNLEHFAGYYLTQDLGIHQLQTQFEITPYAAFLKNLDIRTSHSHLKGDFQLSYQGIEFLSHMPSEVGIIVQLEELKLASQELAHFIPYFKDHNTTYRMRGKMVGKLDDLSVEDFYLEFGKNKSHLSGGARLQDLTNFNNTHFDFDLHKSCLYTADVLPHFAQKHHDVLQRIQLCKVQSNVSGTANHFVVKGNCSTDIGKISTNMEIIIDTTFQRIGYKGDIHTDAFKVGKLLGIDDLHEVSMRAHIDGEGVNSETANFYLKTHIQKVGFQKYKYENIRTDGRFAKAFFKGSVSIEDPNLVTHLDTKIDWREPQKKLFVKGFLSNISVDSLGFADKPVNLSSELSVKLHGTSWDDFTTDATFDRTRLDIQNKPLNLERIHILNGRNGGASTLSIHSDLLDIEAEGAIKYTALVHDIQVFLDVYQQRLLTSKPSVYTYTDHPYIFKYHLNIKDINPLLYLVAPDVYVAPHTTLQGVFSQQQQVKLEIHLSEIDSLAFRDNQLQKCQWNFIALQGKEDSLITATSKLTAFKQQWKDYPATENFELDINWINDQISFKNTVGNEHSDLQLRLAGEANLKNTGILLKLNDTAIRLADKTWELHPANTISIHKSHVRLHNILLSHEAQQISLEGKWSSLTNEKLVISLNNLELDNFSSFISKKIGGTIHGTLLLMGTTKAPKISSNIDIHDITVGDLKIGNLCTKAVWGHSDQLVNVTCQLKHAEQPTIHITGLYNPTSNSQNLDLVAEFSQAQLAVLEPFVTKVFSELKGELTGRFYIKGPLKEPQIDGKGILENMTVKFTYLNALYNGEGVINCIKNNIEIERLHLSDDQEGQVDLRGKVYHTYFKDFRLDLAGDVNKLKVLNTKYEDNEYFYGKGIVTGNITFSGAVDNINIKASAITEKGSSLVIPIKKYNKKVEQENYIRFVDLKNCKQNEIEISRPVRLKGLSLDMNLEITPDAWAEIMLNGKNGDIIQSNGKGNLTIKLDSEGSLSVTGNYEIVEGTYNFVVVKELVSKKFKILEGSTITWIDNPYDGILHVKAAYEQRIPLTPLLRQIKGGSIKNKNKYPVRVLLELAGVLSEPTINYDIKFPSSINNTDLEEAVHAFKERIATDTNYLKDQVFSLVILKSFYIGGVNLDNTTFQRSAGEFFSQQLSSLAAQLDENLEIETDIDLEELNQEKTTSLPIKISYSLLSGRLIVARKSKIDFAAGNEIDVTNLVGDWSVEYGLTNDNRFRIKLDVYPGGAERTASISKPVFSGISFVYVKSFNRWRQFFSRNHDQHYSDKHGIK